MTVQFVFLGERFWAEGALEGLVSSVNPLVIFEVGFLHEGLLAEGALVWRHSSATDVVVKFILLVAECSLADCALEALGEVWEGYYVVAVWGF